MPTAKQIRAAQKISENVRNPKPKPKGKLLREAGYSKRTSQKPKLVTESKGFQELMDEYLPDEKLMAVHQQLLESGKMEHMAFPVESEEQTDDDIRAMLESTGCTVRRIVHGETARHVYFTSPDAAIRKAAVELAYKIKGRITNKFEGKIKGDVNMALVEFIGEDEDDDAGSEASQDHNS